MASLYLAGRTLAEIGVVFGLSHNRIGQILKQLGTIRRKRGMRAGTKLTPPSPAIIARRQVTTETVGLRASHCHPTRRAWVGSMCRDCYQRRLAPDDLRPVLIKGVRQHAAPTLPDQCPKCRVGPPAWQLGHEYARCRLCGADAFVSCGRVVTLKAVQQQARLQNLSAGMTTRPISDDDDDDE